MEPFKPKVRSYMKTWKGIESNYSDTHYYGPLFSWLSCTVSPASRGIFKLIWNAWVKLPSIAVGPPVLRYLGTLQPSILKFQEVMKESQPHALNGVPWGIQTLENYLEGSYVITTSKGQWAVYGNCSKNLEASCDPLRLSFKRLRLWHTCRKFP